MYNMVHTLPSSSAPPYRRADHDGHDERYLVSALSNTSSKSILNAFPRPVTLTLIQFSFVSGWCVLLNVLAQFLPAVGRAVPGLQGGLRYPNRQVITTTAPLAFFQVGGHITSSIATSKIPVSLVHTIKVLPLSTFVGAAGLGRGGGEC
jgi:solute carrier family 35 protein E1